MRSNKGRKNVPTKTKLEDTRQFKHSEVKFLKKSGKGKKPNAAQKGHYTYFATTICLFARCITLEVKFSFIHHFLPRLSAYEDSSNTPCEPLGITPGRFCYRNANFWAQFGYGKYQYNTIDYVNSFFRVCKMGKSRISSYDERLFSFLYKTNRFHVVVRLFIKRSKKTW